jgi:hypothetical protein
MFTDLDYTEDKKPGRDEIRRAAAADDTIKLDAFETVVPGPVQPEPTAAPLTDDDFELDPTPYLLERREMIAEAIPGATGRELAALIGEMNQINGELRELGYFPDGV